MIEAPAIISDRFRMGSDWEIVQKVTSEFQRHYDAKYNEIKRMEHNFRSYSGLDGGAWDDKDLHKLSMEKRVAYIFNLCRGKVDILTGSQIAEKLEMDWVPLEKHHGTSIKLIKDLYNIDKELGDYAYHEALATRDGNIIAGEEEIVIDRSKNGLPYIRFVRLDPAFVVRDTDWLSDDEEDCESAFKVGFNTPLQLKRIFKAKGEVINNATSLIKRFGKTPEFIGSHFDQVTREIKGDTYRTITHYWLDYRDVTRMSGRKIKSPTRMVFPQELQNDNEALEIFMQQHKIDPFTLREFHHEQKINMSTSVCPTLVQDALLGNGKSEIQIGRLQLFHHTNMRVQGRDTGIVDLIKHVNQLVQKDESKISDLIASAQGGGVAANWDAFKRPEDRARFEHQGNDPSAVWFLDGTEMRKGSVFQRVPPNPYPSQVVDRIDRMYGVVDRLSTIPGVLESLSESEDSGVLFERKRQTARIGLMLQSLQKRTTLNRKGEAYINQARITYSGATRVFSSKDGKNSVVLNKRIAKNNKVFIRNSMLMIPRCAVYITESNESLTHQLALRGILFGLFEKVAGTHPEFASVMIREILRTVTFNDSKVEARLNAITDVQEIRDFAKFKADIAGLDAATKTAIFQGLTAKMQTMQLLSGEQGPEEPANEIEQGELQEQTA